MENSTTLEKQIKTPCLSLIIPTHKTSGDRQLDPLEVKKITENAKVLIAKKYGTEASQAISDKLETLKDEIDFTHNDYGLGLFVSGEKTELVKFPFPVTEKLILDNDFALKDRLFLEAYLSPYYVLDLTLNRIQLFKGNGEKLLEVKDEHFPAKFFDDHEYEKTALGSSYGYSLKSTEKDQSIVKEERFISFVKKTDKTLKKYLSNEVPLIITGVKRELGYFLKHSSCASNVAGEVVGNHNQHIEKLGELAFEKIKEYRSKNSKDLIEKLEDNIGKKKAVTGIIDCWNAANEGKGLLLLMEKDLAQTGFVSNDDLLSLHLYKPDGNFQVIADATENIIKTVLEKKGKIVFLDNGALSKFDGIALIERYN